MGRYVVAALLISLCLPAMAQSLKVVPIDQGASDPSFNAFRAKLLAAVADRDIDAVVSAASEDIHLSFGGHNGRDDFRAFLVRDPATYFDEYRYRAAADRVQYWTELERVLRLGGRFEGDGADRSFMAPYSWGANIADDLDPYTTAFITGDGVALRARPIRYAEVLIRLRHDVVSIVEGGDGTPYRKVRLADGTEGYVYQEYVQSLVGYRARFEQVDGRWQMTIFIAGD